MRIGMNKNEASHGVRNPLNSERISRGVREVCQRKTPVI